MKHISPCGAWLCIMLLLLIPSGLKAQYADEEYRMEVGGYLGGVAYMGDANTVKRSNAGHVLPFPAIGL